MSRDPKRWLDEASELDPRMRVAAAAYRADGPSEEQLARMLTKLDAAATLVAPRWQALKLWSLPLLGVAIAAAWLSLRAAQQVARLELQLPIALESASMERTRAPQFVSVARERRKEPQAGDGKSLRRHEPSVSARVDTTRPSSELELLQRARRVLGSDPQRALVLTDEHLRRFPRGALLEERELLAVEALVALGRPGDARERALAHLHEHPHAVHRARIESALEHAESSEPRGPARHP